MDQNKNIPPTLQRLGFIVNRTSWAMRRRVQSAIISSGHNLTPEQWISLNLLFEMGEMTQTELAWVMNAEKASVTRMIDALSEQGLVERKPFPDDRRKHMVSISKEGIEVRAVIAPQVFEQYEKMVEGITEEEKQVVTNILTRITEQAK